MRKLVTILSLVLLLLVVVWLKSNQEIDNKTELTLSINNKIDNFDSGVIFNDDGMLLLAQSLESLYQYHYLKRPYEMIPALAEDLPEISSDGLIYKFKIKKGIKYHQGQEGFFLERDVRAEDFMWAIKRLAFLPLKSNGAWLFSGKIKDFDNFSKRVGSHYDKFLMDSIDGVRVTGDYTLEIHLVKPEPNLLYYLSMHFTAPIPLEAIKFFKNDFSNVILGTGPYVYNGFKDNVYTFKRFKGFREEYYPSSGDRYANTENLLTSSKMRLPFINSVSFKVIPEEEKRWGAFLKGDLDLLDVPKQLVFKLTSPNTETTELFERKGISVKHFSRQTTRWVGLNMNDPVLGQNLNLRKAIAFSIDRDRYIKILTNNTNLKSNSIFNPSIKGFRPSHKLSYKYDLEKAKIFFKKAGYKPGDLSLTYTTRGKEGIHLKEANFFKNELAKVGIDLKIETSTFREFLNKGRANKLQIWTDNWIYDYPDAENILQLLVSSNSPGINKSGYSNTKVDRLYQELSRTLDEKKRFEIMYEIEDVVERELPWIMLMYESTYIVQQEGIQNFRKSFFIRNFVKYLKKAN